MRGMESRDGGNGAKGDAAEWIDELAIPGEDGLGEGRLSPGTPRHGTNKFHDKHFWSFFRSNFSGVNSL